MNRANFGRRSPPKSPQPALPVMMKSKGPRADAAPRQALPVDPVAAELKAWKKSRGPSPYLKPLALMASLSFGVASVALPAAINHWAEYPLYALSAASLYAGFRRKHMTGKP